MLSDDLLLIAPSVMPQSHVLSWKVYCTCVKMNIDYAGVYTSSVHIVA